MTELLGRNPSDNELESFATEAINYMIERTQSGHDIKGDKFKAYTEDYADKKGVSRGDVDLTLFGDMLSSIVSDFQGDEVIIQMAGDLEIKKAYNHNVGDTLPKRTFFGLTRDEAKNIAEKIRGTEINIPDQFNLSEILANIGIQVG